MIGYFGPHHTPLNEYPVECRYTDEANCERAAACWNALAGLNPEAVAELISSSEDYFALNNEANRLRFRAALAALKGAQ